MFHINYILGGPPAYRDWAMRRLLAMLTMVDKEYLLDHPEALSPTALRYQEEPEGEDDWLDASALQVLKRGDGEDIAAYTAGWLQARHGIDAWPQLVTDEAGCMNVVVETPDGRRYDPTLALGRIPRRGYACTALTKRGPEQKITIVTNLFKTKSMFIGFDGRPISQTLAHKSLSLMLHALWMIDVHYLNHYPAPAIYDSGVVYQEEPLGREDWQDIPSTLMRREGDCEDLASWRAAELCVRHRIDAYPTFIWRTRPSGVFLYHIQCTYPDGRVEDPSRRLGMGANRK